MHLTRQLVLCKYGVLQRSNCYSAYRPENNLYLTRCCCINCANSIWIGGREKRNEPFCRPEGDPVHAVEVIREESPDEVGIKAGI